MGALRIEIPDWLGALVHPTSGRAPTTKNAWTALHRGGIDVVLGPGRARAAASMHRYVHLGGTVYNGDLRRT